MREWNTKTKNKERVLPKSHKKRPKYDISLVFPDRYSIGISNLGFLWVYGLLDSYPQIRVHRFFWEEGELFSPDRESVSLKNYDLILFSISFELNYVNVLKILVHSEIPAYSIERSDSSPLIFAGGVATLINPEPIADFVDGFLLGEFEAIKDEFIDCLDIVTDRTKDRLKKLECLSKRLYFFYAPRLFVPVIEDKKFIGFEKRLPDIEIRPAYASDLPVAPHSTIISSESVFKDMFLVEIVRGCGMNCRFCAAGHVYRPPRSWSLNSIKEAIDQSEKLDTNRIGLVGLDYISKNIFTDICKYILDKDLKLSFSSLRIDNLTQDYLDILKNSDNNTITIAPEAGSEILRKRINKSLTEEDIFHGLEIILKAMTKNLKLYFMIGLPYENWDDIKELVELVKKIRGIFVDYGKKKGNLGEIKVSISPFVPKPWTPFQFLKAQDEVTIEKKLEYIKDNLKRLPNVKISHDGIKSYKLQEIISKGSRNAGKLIFALTRGNTIKKAINDFLELHRYEYEDGFISLREPWSIVNNRIKREYLLSEYKKSEKGEASEICKIGKCRKCGACSYLIKEHSSLELST